MCIIPIGLGLGRVRGQVGDGQLQADVRLPTQGKQSSGPVLIPARSEYMHLEDCTPLATLLAWLSALGSQSCLSLQIPAPQLQVT